MSKYQAECQCSIKHMYKRTKLQFNNEMHNCLHFYNSGKEMASVFHLHFRNSPRPCACYGVLCRGDNRPIKSLTNDSGGLGGQFMVQNFHKNALV